MNLRKTISKIADHIIGSRSAVNDARTMLSQIPEIDPVLEAKRMCDAINAQHRERVELYAFQIAERWGVEVGTAAYTEIYCELMNTSADVPAAEFLEVLNVNVYAAQCAGGGL